MAETQTVTAPETPDAAGDGKREQSTISFPYQDLDEAIEIAKAIHELHGSQCSTDQIAAHIGQSLTSSSFKGKVATAKIFGLVTTSQGGMVSLTPLGSKIADSQQEKAARVEAFLNVPLYKAVYDQFKGTVLPPQNGLEAAIGSLGVALKQRERARQVLQRSAQQAGFFQFGTDRLIMPAIKASGAPAPTADSTEDTDADRKRKAKDDDDEEEMHPFIKGLLRKLPKPDSEWTVESRAKWLQAAVNIFDLMYTDSDDSRRTLSIDFKKDSAK
jgi:hypothetical protein